MAVETEIKLHLPDLEKFSRALESVDRVLLSPRHFEDNFVLDYPEGRLRTQGCLIRVRRTKDGSILTYKGAAQPSGVFKTRDELEVRLDDGQVALEILHRLGLRLWFRYQKYRQEYIVPLGKQPGQEVHLALDETPVGSYAELEGPEECIRQVATRLGFAESKFLRDSYYSLYVRFCNERGMPPGHMLFPDSPTA